MLAPLLERQRCSSLHKLRKSQIKLNKLLGRKEEEEITQKIAYFTPVKQPAKKSPRKNRNALDLSAQTLQQIKLSASKRIEQSGLMKTGGFHPNISALQSKIFNTTQYKESNHLPKKIIDICSKLGLRGNIDDFILSKVQTLSKKSEKIYAIKKSLTITRNEEYEDNAAKCLLTRQGIEDLNEWMLKMLAAVDSNNIDYPKIILLYALRELAQMIATVCNEAGILLQSIVYLLLNYYVKEIEQYQLQNNKVIKESESKIEEIHSTYRAKEVEVQKKLEIVIILQGRKNSQRKRRKQEIL